jgi:hypothetical protein
MPRRKRQKAGEPSGRDVFQAVMAAMAAALLQAGRARRQVQLVMHHQDFIGQNLVKCASASTA